MGADEDGERQAQQRPEGRLQPMQGKDGCEPGQQGRPEARQRRMLLGAQHINQEETAIRDGGRHAAQRRICDEG